MFTLKLRLRGVLGSDKHDVSIRHSNNKDSVYIGRDEYKSLTAILEEIQHEFPNNDPIDKKIDRNSEEYIIEVRDEYQGLQQLERICNKSKKSKIEEIRIWKSSILGHGDFVKIDYPNGEPKSEQREYVSEDELLEYIEERYVVHHYRWKNNDLFLVCAEEK